MMQRTAMRELAFKLVYEIEVQKENNEEHIQIFLENNEITDEKVIEYLTNVINGLKANEVEIDELISKNLKENWSLSRIPKITLSLLKLAIFEMVYAKIPYKVAINEVVELAKKYADEVAPTFINGILASIVKEKCLDKED
ncbi:MAG: transcription antitermination factor NusB [Clostridia bacterium]|nr:transcription antitermination factor NusB [Clostridia bacterium]